MKINKILRRIAKNAMCFKTYEGNQVIVDSPLILPGLLDDSAQRLAMEAKHAADTKAGVEKINLHPELLSKKHNNTTAHISGGHNFLKNYFQYFTKMYELYKSYTQLYNSFSLQKVYL